MLKQKSFLAFLTNILQSLIGFVSVYFVAHYMGPEAMGIIASALAFAGMFSIFSDLGFGLAHFKKISEGLDEAKCIGTFFNIKLVITPITALLIIITYFFTAYILHKPIIPQKYFVIVIITVITFMIGDFTQVIQYTFAAKVEKAKESIVIISSKFFTAFFRIIVAISGFSVVYLAISNLFGASISIAVGLYLFKGYKVSKPDRATFLSYKSFAIPSMFIGVTAIIYQQLDKVAIAFFASSTEVGYYTAGQSLIMIMSFINTIFLSLLLPTYSKLYSENKLVYISKLASKIERYISLLLMPIGFFIFFNSNLIQQVLLGPRFTQSVFIMKILVINAIFLILSQPYTSQIMGMNRIKIASVVSALVLIFNAILYVLFIPTEIFGVKLFSLGATGAAIAQLISSIVSVIIFRLIANKLTGSKQDYKIFIHLIVAIFTYGGVSYFTATLNAHALLIISLNLILATIVYIILLVAIKELNKSDLIYYLELINPVLMNRYINGEFRNDKK